jgi:endonuclease/exonuclease/phosphatase family metal-dependent hydrolase
MMETLAGRTLGGTPRCLPGLLGLLGLLGLPGCVPDTEAGPPGSSGRARVDSPVDSPVDSIELASWNLAWLNSQDGKGAVARREADYARLRAYAARLDADVIALQEIADEAAARRVLDPAVYAFALADERDTQRAGFAYKKTLRVERHADVAALDVGAVRRGVDITIDLGGERLRLLGVHLKSGCFSGALERSAAACAKLRQQLPPLEAWVDAREREGVPFAVLGDFNRRLRQGDPFWTELDDRDPVPTDLTLVTEGRKSRCWNGVYPDFIDHIVLDAQAAAWLVPDSFDQLVYDASDALHRKTLSDHCPISVQLAPAGARRVARGPGVARGATPGAGVAPGPVVAPGPGARPGAAPGPGARPGAAPGPGARPGALPVPGGAKRGPGARPGPLPGGAGNVKGNIARGRKLYHLPGCPSYDEVRIEPDKGERLFESEREAQAAGFRKAGNCP